MERHNGIRSSAASAVLALMLLSPGQAHAQEAGNAERGGLLAESWCASCHIIDAKGSGQSVEAAPPFPGIAKDPAKDKEFFHTWLTTKHPQMPNLDLGRREINDLAAYIRTLAPQR